MLEIAKTTPKQQNTFLICYGISLFFYFMEIFLLGVVLLPWHGVIVKDPVRQLSVRLHLPIIRTGILAAPEPWCSLWCTNKNEENRIQINKFVYVYIERII